jgi:hypothetical protein
VIAWVPLSKDILIMLFPFLVTDADCEAVGMKHALALALSNDFERVIFESDCQQVVNVLRIMIVCM